MPVVASLANASAGGFGFNKPQGLTYRWVSVGNNGVLQTCDDTTGTTWTSRTSSFGTSDVISDVASNGKNLYVAVGSGGKLATSPDGITWTQRTSSFGTSDIYGIAYGLDGYWVAVGQDSKLATSTDGITWTQRTTGATSDILSVYWGNNIWLISVFIAGEVLTASNPTSTWTLRNTTISGFTSGTTYDPTIGIWVSGRDTGTTNAIASSTNGVSWTGRTSTISAQQNPYLPNYFLQHAVSNGSVIVLAAIINWNTSPMTYDFESSTNGTSWTNRTPADATETINCAASDNLGNMMFAGGSIQISSDGINWTKGTGNTNANGLCHSSGTESIR